MFTGYVFLFLFIISVIILPFLPKRIISWWMTNIMESFLFLNGVIEGRDKYLKFKNECAKGVLIFTHPYWFDMFPIIHLLGEVPRGTIKAKYLKFPLNLFANRFKALAVQDQPSGLSAVIKESIENRKPGEELICICPVGTTTSTYQDEVPEYKSKGTFYAMPTIMPIVMYYSFFSVWDKQSLLDMVYERISGDILYYYVKVLDPISPNEDEKMEDYMLRVHDYTQEGLLQCKREFRIKQESESYNKEQYSLEIAYVLFIFYFISNIYLIGILAYLSISRFIWVTPQYNLLYRMYMKILFVYIIYTNIDFYIF